MASIKEIALEAAITREKDVLEKAKEIGISVKSVSTNLTEEESNILYQYITTGKLPDGYKKPSKSKPKSPKKAYSKEKIPTQEPTKEKDTSQNAINVISKTDNLESKIDVSQIKDDEASNAQQELKQARSARANETANIKGTILQTEVTPVIFNEPKKAGKPNIISKGKHNESKLDIKDIKSNQINSNLDKEDRENQAYTDITRQDIKLAIQENKDEMTTAINNDEGIKTESIKPAKEIDKKKSLEDSKINETNNKNTSPVSTSQDMQTLGNLPQGFDPSINKKPKINLVRVIRKNNKKPESNDPKKEREAAQILDSLKHTEHKGKTKKKKEKTAAKQQKQQSHQIINMERDMGVSGYDYEQDEIMLIDMYESPQENLEEKENKKNQIDEKIKVSHYSPWIKEGSIARPSRGRSRKSKEQKAKRNNDVITSLVLPEEIRVYEFAEKANLELGNVLGKLFLLGMKVLKNDFLDKDTIEILAGEYNIDVTIQQNTPLDSDQDEILESDLTHRPPVVTIMGHVDHGKTSLLDYIRNSRIVNSEAGGITQHIGAYMVQKNDKWISFIDTPGHEAFAQMRSRGAQVTDIAIIVIAADDGVKQQSIEALNHAKSANVQIIIAMNKIDKEGANLDKLKSECAELGFTPIDWGGDYEFIPISAKTGEGVDVLLETILLQAEILDLKASKTAKAKAIVLEGSQQVGKGSVATIIVRQGVLEIGQCIVADTAYGKVRTLRDDTGKSITKLEPSGVAQITGLSEVPSAGALLQVVENDSIAREIANKRSAYLRQKQLSRSTKVTFDELSSMVAKGQIKSVPIVLRADTQGSLEAIKASLESLNNKEVEINVISFGIGGITQSDINLANASNNCIVLGFNVRPTSDIKHLAKDLGITIKSYSIIYDLIDDMKALLSGLMSPITEEEVVGILSVRETFIVAKIGTIAGCMVLDGKVERNLSVRVLRNGVVVWNGKIASLKRFKDDVKEVTKGYECGIMLDGFNDIVVQDEVEVFKEILKQRTL
ncbi:translation initiation factor IF-2 [Helicobacter muridarum]|uniref:Translation initiation factor IF-2 n=1 Tax=Helicobacter muridarum TaxID=216 RepID=A0A377PT92_9HELI|nr:translation initiation factor IF-2 [Helicobacter muridarum]TLE00582.1 translation initiation factor IF-2 [Helicobacter muridarum]STQ85594.1 translation initiation factor IF-2 [Helicobacter muridarum]